MIGKENCVVNHTVSDKAPCHTESISRRWKEKSRVTKTVGVKTSAQCSTRWSTNSSIITMQHLHLLSYQLLSLFSALLLLI